MRLKWNVMQDQLFGRVLTASLALVIAGCASTAAVAPPQERAAGVTRFSTVANNALPGEWKPFIMSRLLKNTEYRIVHEDGKPILEARSDSAASGLMQEVMIDPNVNRYLSWRWKAPQLIPQADNTRRGSDDSPVRVIVAFDGDKKKFDFEDRAFADLVKLFSGREMPYATLMYIWENKLPVDSIVENANTGRAKMIVAESGAARVGQWLTFTRDVVEDYRRAYGEEPGPIISVGVMTDSNRTGTQVTSFYGDIAFHNAPKPAPLAANQR
jgi:Protein of unknown function (DUF3047)